MMLDKKQIQAIFLFKFTMGGKAAETIHNINNTFGSETANKCTVPWWFKEFCKGDKSLEGEEHSDWPLDIDSAQWRALIEADYMKSCPRTQRRPLYGCSAFEANCNGEKAQ